MLRRVNVGPLEALVRAPLNSFEAGGIGAPVCQLCGRHVDSEELVEKWPTGARVLVKHHGAEELASFELGTRDWDCDDLARAMRGHPWFRPETMAANEQTHSGRTPDYEPTAEGKIFGGIIGPDGNVLVPANDTAKESA